MSGTLQEWADRFNSEFKLHIPEFVLRVDVLSRSCYGHFRYGHNGFGLRGEVAINVCYMNGVREPWEILGTLLHELLHAWQQAYGKPGKGNYHNAEFRSKALHFGLIIDRDGHTQYLAKSPFMELLGVNGVEVPNVEAPVEVQRIRGNSKLKKWSCECTNVRCAIANLHAQCLNCGQVFRMQE